MASSSAGGKIRISIFIVFLMVSMTWSAGINDIVAKYEPTDRLSDSTSFEANAVVTPSQEVQERRFMLIQSMVQRLGRVRLIVQKIV